MQTREYLEDYTFEEYIEVFISEKSVVLSPVTVINYERELRRSAVSLGREKMKEITFLRMKKYFYGFEERERNIRNGRKLSYGTLRQHFIVLHSFFENALENEVVSENPMRRAKSLFERKQDAVREPLSYDEDQVRYIIRCLENEPLMWRAAVMFAIDSGCRSGEVMGLKWSDINLETGRVSICRNIRYTASLGTFESSPKSGKNRVIFLNRPVLKCMEELKKQYDRVDAERNHNGADGKRRNLVEIIGKETDQGYCFAQKDGSPLIPVAFNNFLSSFGRKYNLPGIHPHALRHTMASLSIANGADIVSVSNKLGHASVSITLDVYSHANTRAQIRANEVLAEAIY